MILKDNLYKSFLPEEGGLQIIDTYDEYDEIELLGPIDKLKSNYTGHTEWHSKRAKTGKRDIKGRYNIKVKWDNKNKISRIKYLGVEPEKDWELDPGVMEINFSKKPIKITWCFKGERTDYSDSDFKVFSNYRNKLKIEKKSKIKGGKKIKRKDLKRRLFLERKACQITQCDIEEALQVAHILPVKKDGPDDTSNLMLLRADMHLLFDKEKIKINKDTGKITVKDKNVKKTYSRYFEKPLKLHDFKYCQEGFNLRHREENKKI